MAYFLVTGDEQGDPEKLRKLLDEHVIPTPMSPRRVIRIEAENFRTLDGCEVEYRNDRTASHRICVRFAGDMPGGIRTRFDEPYAAPSGRYDVDVRYSGGPGGATQFSFWVNGRQQGAVWEAAAAEPAWQTQTFHGVAVGIGDEIRVDVRRGSGGEARLDYVQLNLKPSEGPK
jgi:hypothetical protein